MTASFNNLELIWSPARLVCLRLISNLTLLSSMKKLIITPRLA